MSQPPLLFVLADRFMIRWILRLLLVHMLCCVWAVFALILLPFGFWNFVMHVNADNWPGETGLFLGEVAGTVALVYIAIRGYWLIKHGTRRGGYYTSSRHRR